MTSPKSRMFSGCGGLGTTAYALSGDYETTGAARGNGEHGSCDDECEEPASSQWPGAGREVRRDEILRGVGWHRASFSVGWCPRLRQIVSHAAAGLATSRSFFGRPRGSVAGQSSTLQAVCATMRRKELPAASDLPGSSNGIAQCDRQHSSHDCNAATDALPPMARGGTPPPCAERSLSASAG
jgi:hypothetical protein